MLQNQISKTDLLPNFVCQICWTIIEAIHKLYQKSKETEANFRRKLIKIKSGSFNGDILLPAKRMEQIFDEDSQGVSLIKLEPNFG